MYTVLPTRGKPDPVPVVAAFTVGWRSTDYPGQCLADDPCTTHYFLTSVPRSQSRHYDRIAEADALQLYLDLLR